MTGPHPITINSVWRMAAPWTHIRVQVVEIHDSADQLIGQNIGRDGKPWSASGRWAYPMRHFRWGDPWVPDDTGLPAMKTPAPPVEEEAI